MRCQFAACEHTATDMEDGWHFCQPCLRIHRVMVAEENGKPCTRCGVSFHSGVTQRRLCDGCQAERKHERAQQHQERKQERLRVTAEQWQRQAGAT